ncbi:MAG TPA: alpha-glucan family phosphorylase [Bacteroidales bacterium]|nr:alpha-glucan family phosphorylase [Bacteroidales bacterium]
MTERNEEEMNLPVPDFIFEVSWEVCNKIGGINTVIATKTPVLKSLLQRDDQLIMIGPDVWKETTNHPHFEEDLMLMKSWREYAAREGLYFRVGRWKTEGNPVAILVDFTSFFPEKDKIFAVFWEDCGLDSISGQWDYIEPAMFGYAAARVIESYYRIHLSPRDRVLAQFHEWMTGTGILYLRKNTPGIATAFTTHATVLGRSMAGNGKALYSSLGSVSPELLAAEFQVKSKHSLETLSANLADVFTTVSEITGKECQHLLGKSPDVITPNGFDSRLVPETSLRQSMREDARKRITGVAESLFGTSFPDDSLLVLTSGRYEFRNKGIDLFIDAMAELASGDTGPRRILAVIAVPAYHHGPRPDLLNRLQGDAQFPLSHAHHSLTHMLNSPEIDPVLRKMEAAGLSNHPEGKVFVCFVPTYLTGNDGIFNLNYYAFLSGFDLTLFPSYYEPWGYTPLESIAYGIPTATTSLAGFGRWIQSLGAEASPAVKVIQRTDDSDTTVTAELSAMVRKMLSLSPEAYLELSRKSMDIASEATWQKFIGFYLTGYQQALAEARERGAVEPYPFSNGKSRFLLKEKDTPQWNKILVKSAYPPQLDPLKKLSDNLWWTWNHKAEDLFRSIDPDLWQESGNNPVKLLSLLSYNRLMELADDQNFINELKGVYQEFSAYISSPPEKDLPEVAYFSMEFGLHESLKIYSGGLGILAGDYMKEASDDNKKITGIGLLYRYGYFTQKITPYGDQEAGYYPQKFSDLPIHPIRNAQGEWVTISIAFPGRNVYAKVWRVDIGRVKLYLLDADTEKNAPHDRFITHQLYGGDLENRFKQEMLLGVGGIRLLEALDINPDLYHCNEGHAALLNFERLRDLVQQQYLSFPEALEVIRASTLFTTHTPVPAGHDAFPEEMLRAYIAHYPERYHITWDELISLGKINPDDPAENFSMSVLAINTAQEVNGVSALHGRVSRAMFIDMFPGYFEDELHIGHVTNGVHYPTWASHKWQSIHTRFLKPDLSDQHLDAVWAAIDQITDEEIWNTRCELRNDLLKHLAIRMRKEMTTRQESPGHIVRVLETLEQPWLTIGFARRFATYKRAGLLFSNEQRLSQLLNNRKRPLRFVFAGKAHPNDKAGQDLIKRIVEISRKPAFEGKVLFVENYDMELGRFLTQGCDVWLNNPTRPQEASGTSGEKAAMNGVLNLSVLDGWWAEGYQPEAGWALPEENTYLDGVLQDQLDAESIYNIIEDHIAALYYDRNANGIPQGWIRYIRNNFKYITPRFTMKRMLNDYHAQYYHKLAGRHSLMTLDGYRNARELAAWKRRIMLHWEHITLVEKHFPDSTISPLNLGEDFRASVVIDAPGLGPDDLGVEVVFGEKRRDVVHKVFAKETMTVTPLGNGRLQFDCAVPIRRAGVFDYAFRLFPNHPLLVYRMDFPWVKWL